MKTFYNSEQSGSIDRTPRQYLWNTLCTYYWSRITTITVIYSNSIDFDTEHPLQVEYNKILKDMLKSLWTEHLSNSIEDFMSFSYDSWIIMQADLKKYFFNCTWKNALEFIAFISIKDPVYGRGFIETCNGILEKNSPSHRIVNGKPIETISSVDRQNVDQILSYEYPIRFVQEHINTALKLLHNGDFRNSIKESISAVECICKLITKDKKLTLGEALKKIDKNLNIHKALQQAFQIMYGYTSDADGIRHALMKESSLDYEDALYMVTTCSAFINYLTIKAKKCNIDLCIDLEE